MKVWQYWLGWFVGLGLLWIITIGPVFWLQSRILAELREIVALLKEVG